MIVLDSSAVVEWLLNTAAGKQVDQRIVASLTLHAPHLVDIEVAHTLRRLVSAGKLLQDRGAQALEDLSSLGLTRYEHELFLPRVWSLRHNLTAYDAVYVALAEKLGVPLVTCDGRIASAAGHWVQMDVIPLN